ncbi:hypothetical protein DIPPA_17426 [Diplonema papillatum]|nr:hypothetical protein DIPPA_17426 [Diplonema papillatum]
MPPFSKQSQTGYANFAVPADVRDAFEESVGPTLARRNVRLSEVEEWAVFFFGDDRALAHKVMCDLLEYGAGSPGASVVGTWEGWKLAATLAEASLVNQPLFRRVMKAAGSWKEDAPEVPSVAGAGRRVTVVEPSEPEESYVPLPRIGKEGVEAPPDPLTPPGAVEGGKLVPDEVSDLKAELRALREVVMAMAGRASPQASTAQPTRFPVEETDVTKWRDALERDPEGLALALEVRYVAGRKHLPGGEQLDAAFSALKCWLLASAQFESWFECVEQVRLGQELLMQLRVQLKFVEEGAPRRELLERMRQRDDDELERATAGWKKDAHRTERKRFGFKPRSKAGWKQGNVKAGEK